MKIIIDIENSDFDSIFKEVIIANIINDIKASVYKLEGNIKTKLSYTIKSKK